MVKNVIDFESVAADVDRVAKVVESGWCQGAYARDEDGEDVFEGSEAAVSFCIAGAILTTMVDDGPRHGVRDCLAHTLGIAGDELIGWNDHENRTQTQVVDLCRDTAKRLRSSTPLPS